MVISTEHMNTLSKLDNIRNFRSLYQVGTINGKRLPYFRFFKCGSLSHASQETLNRLVTDYKVKLIIDLRSTKEAAYKPEPIIEGITNLHIPVIEETRNTVAKGLDKKSYARHIAGYDELIETYRELGKSAYSLSQFGKAVRACLDLEKGAVLWHCSAGKDRTGILAYLLLKLFGCSDKQIFHDYMRSNRTAKPFARKMAVKTLGETKRLSLARKIWRSSTVHRKYLQAFIDSLKETCGSVDNFYNDYCRLNKYAIQTNRMACLK